MEDFEVWAKYRQAIMLHILYIDKVSNYLELIMLYSR